jgi:hypothetical protein
VSFDEAPHQHGCDQQACGSLLSYTRQYYPQLIGFVSTWERYLDKPLPREVVARMSISERSCIPYMSTCRLGMTRYERSGTTSSNPRPAASTRIRRGEIRAIARQAA